ECANCGECSSAGYISISSLRYALRPLAKPTLSQNSFNQNLFATLTIDTPERPPCV
ncbi:MAG: hypothetical protein HQK51_18575, partial [Oligoflexia bacterium]|nr:hypothetical protein [Oligoflexia bacterium]